MWHFKFLGILLSVCALLGFIESRTALAAYPAASEFSTSQPQETRGFDGSFQLAVMGGSAIPLDMPPEKSPEKAQPEKPAVEKPKVIQVIPKVVKKASNPQKKKVKKASVKKAPAKKPVEEENGFLSQTLKTLMGSDDDDKKEAASEVVLQRTAGKKSEPEKKEDGLFTQTLKTLVGGDDDKKEAAPKSPSAKTVKKIPAPEKEEEGLLTKTLKSLVGNDKKKDQATEKTTLNPITMAPTGSATQKKEEVQPKTAKSETRKTLKDSFEKLIGVGTVKDKGDAGTAKTDKPAGGETKTVKKEDSGGLLNGILTSDDKKDSPQQAKAKAAAVEKAPVPVKAKRLTAKKLIEEEEEQNEEDQLEKDRGGVKKGKNVLKESFKNLVIDKKK